MSKRPPFPASLDDPGLPSPGDDWSSLVQEDVPAVDGFFAGDSPETVPSALPDPGPDSLDAAALAALCAERVCPGCPEKREAEDVRLRALSDLDNARKRMAREREEQVRFAAEAVLTAIIPSLDNLNLALQHAASAEVCADFVTGVRMTRDLLMDALHGQGLQAVGAAGEVFDPARHEAVGLAACSQVPEGCVCSLLASGYTLHGRLLRPAKVLVCKNEV
ncbi:MAG: nucleotide exchange factor GrpE [Desulfovibrio sp.]|jgi:molecular chaperone GrpE|nr:nucleotide exchange factor GrpE [Desulfovibrio sp.]